MTTRTRPEVVVRHPDELGESPAYDAPNRRLVWTDLFGQCVRELRWTGATWEPGRTWEVDDLACAVVPRRRGGLLVATRTDLVGLADDGGAEVVVSIEVVDLAGGQLNDAKCDPQGRLLVGWLVRDGSGPGGLVRVDGDGSVETLLADVGLANGIDWSPHGETLYFADSAALRVDAFDYDGARGRISERRTVVTVESGVGAPNGLATDDDGCLWIALTYAGQVRRHDPDGHLVEIIDLPTPRPTSCAFGGPDGRELFITSASFAMPSSTPRRLGIARERIDAAERDEAGGALYVVRTETTGPPATAFAG